MTSFVPMTSTRQPFGMVDQSRLQGLTSLKNRQNALPSNDMGKPVLSQKRRLAPTTSSDEDGENIDPATFGSPTKKSKFNLGQSSTGLASKFHLHTTPTLTPSSTNAFSAPRPIRTPASPSARLRGNTSIPLSTTPTSAPAAGRSPKNKRIGILSRRRVSASPFTRIDPPASLCSAPFSIDAALENTFNLFNGSPAPAPAPAAAAPLPVPTESLASASEWNIRRLKPTDPGMSPALFFDIYEDTEEETLTNLMEHSTNVLDISDDEGRKTEKSARGKENVPPMDLQVPEPSAVQIMPAVDPASLPLPPSPSSKKRRRADMSAMTDEPEELRAPLGDLNPEDFAAEKGEVENAHEEEASEVQLPAESAVVPAPSKETFDFESPVPLAPVEAVPEAEAAVSLQPETEVAVEVDAMEAEKEQALPTIVVEETKSEIQIFVDSSDVAT